MSNEVLMKASSQKDALSLPVSFAKMSSGLPFTCGGVPFQLWGYSAPVTVWFITFYVYNN